MSNSERKLFSNAESIEYIREFVSSNEFAQYVEIVISRMAKSLPSSNISELPHVEHIKSGCSRGVSEFIEKFKSVCKESLKKETNKETTEEEFTRPL